MTIISYVTVNGKFYAIKTHITTSGGVPNARVIAMYQVDMVGNKTQ